MCWVGKHRLDTTVLGKAEHRGERTSCGRHHAFGHENELDLLEESEGPNGRDMHFDKICP